MATVMTGGRGILAYFDGLVKSDETRAFGLMGDFHRPLECSFAGLSAFSCNSNHAPTGLEGGISWDAGVDLLFRIAGAR